MHRLLACLALLLLAAAYPTTADDKPDTPDTQIGDWIFKLPESMRIVTGLNGKPAFAFRNTPDNYSTSASFTFSDGLKGEDSDKAFNDWCKEGREALKKQFSVDGDGEITETTTAEGYSMLAWAAVYEDQRHVNWLTILSCLHRGARAGSLLYFTNDFDRLQGQAAAMDALLNHATFASCRPEGEKPPKLKTHIDPLSTPSFVWDPAPELPRGNAGLEGIYGATTLSAAGDPREWTTTTRVTWRYYAFFADGRVMREVPPEGLLCFSFEYWQQHFPRDCGKYKLTDDAVEMTFDLPGGKTEKETLKRNGDVLMDGDKPYPKLPGEAKLSGTFRRIDAKDLAEGHRQAITFNADGTFSDEGFNSTINVGWWVGGDCTLRDITPVEGKGRWKAEKNTLELIYDDGRRRRFAFHRYADQPEEFPKVIVLNGNLLSAQ